MVCPGWRGPVWLVIAAAVVAASCSSSDCDEAANPSTSQPPAIAAAGDQAEIGQLEEQLTVAIAERDEAIARAGDEWQLFVDSVESWDRSEFYPDGDPVVTVFLDDSLAANQSQIDQMLAGLEERSGIVDASYVSKSMALEEALELFADDEKMVQTLTENPDLLPASLRFSMSSWAEGLMLRHVADGTDGVLRATLGTPENQ